ncbi:Retrovirus-related Pol polyprotein from transposon RE1 [Linum perenne]
MSNMVSEPHNQSYSDSVSTRFDGSNYALWAYQFRTLIKGKGLLPYLDGSKSIPTAASVAAASLSIPDQSDPTKARLVTTTNLEDLIAAWEMADAKVLSYILGSVDSSIALSLRSFPTSAAVWKHLQTTYSNISTSRLFDLEYALANLSQGELDVNSYYLAADNLWTEIDLLSASMLSTAAHVEIQAERRRARSFQFLMRLRPEFEQIRSQLLSGNKTEMSEIIGELKRAETRLRTQAQLDNLSSPNAPGTVFAAGKFKPQFFSNNSKSSTDASRNNSTGANLGKNMNEIRCHHCQELGHYISQCRKRNICTYCKKPGHLITDCRLRARNNARTGRNTSGLGYMVHDSIMGSNVASETVSTLSSASHTDNQSIASLVQAVQALTSVFATTGVSGSSDQEDDRNGK